MFIGYGQEDFGYRLWDPMNKKIIKSRDVIFLEDQTIENFKEKKEKPTLVTSNYHGSKNWTEPAGSTG